MTNEEEDDFEEYYSDMEDDGFLELNFSPKEVVMATLMTGDKLKEYIDITEVDIVLMTLNLKEVEEVCYILEIDTFKGLEYIRNEIINKLKK